MGSASKPKAVARNRQGNRPDDRTKDRIDDRLDGSAGTTGAMQTAMQTVVGRATASSVSAMPDQRKVYGMYRGMPPISLLISRFLREHEDSGIERKAGELLRKLDQSGNREGCYAAMEELARKGSRLATYVLAVARLNGRDVEKDEKAAMKALTSLCRQKFPPAFAQLADTLTPRDLSLHKGRALLPIVRKGIGMGDVRCLNLAALAWMDGWFVPASKEGTTIIRGLYEAAYSGSWDCLATLLELYEVIPPGSRPEETWHDALELARMAALDGMPEAMMAWGRFLASTSIGHDPADGLPWLRKSWKAGSLEGGVEYADALQRIYPDNPEALEEARHVLEECCEQIYPDAMAHLGRMEIEAYKADGLCIPGLDLMHHAATLGSSRLYVETLWKTLVKEPENPEIRDECVKRLQELVRYHNDTNARLCLAHYELHARKIATPGEKHPLTRLEELAGEGERRACSLLATIYAFGFHGIARNFKKAAHWHQQATTRHDPRAWSLFARRTLRQFGPNMTAERQECYEELAPLLEWLSVQHDDDLAIAVSAIEWGLLYDPASDIFFDSLDQELADGLVENVGGMFQMAIRSALEKGDLVTLLTALQAFVECPGHSLHQRIAAHVLEDWKGIVPQPGGTPLQTLTHLCFAMLISLGEVDPDKTCARKDWMKSMQ